MIKLAIPDDAWARHCAAYAEPIRGVLAEIASGRPVDTLSKGNHVRWLDPRCFSKNERAYWQMIHDYNFQHDLISLAPSQMEVVCKRFDAWEKKVRGKKSLERIKTKAARLFDYDRFGRGYKLEFHAASGSNHAYIQWVDNHEEWSAWHFIKSLQVSACCYCNADNVFTVLLDADLPGRKKHKQSDYKRSALDHYYAHATYPFLGITLANLVPACTRCNTNVKGAKPLHRELHIHPYEESMDGGFAFRLAFDPLRPLITLGEKEVAIEVLPRGADGDLSRRSVNTAEFFHLKEVYNQCFIGDALSCAQRLDLLSKDYLAFLEAKYPTITKEIENKALFGVSFKRSEINQHPLSKLYCDIRDQLSLS